MRAPELIPDLTEIDGLHSRIDKWRQSQPKSRAMPEELWARGHRGSPQTGCRSRRASRGAELRDAEATGPAERFGSAWRQRAPQGAGRGHRVHRVKRICRTGSAAGRRTGRLSGGDGGRRRDTADDPVKGNACERRGIDQCLPGALMIQITPQMRVLVAIEPVDFRRGIDGLAQLCRSVLSSDPMDGTVFVFRSRASKSIKLLVYDSQGFWLCQKRLSVGKFRHWPTATDAPASSLLAHEFQALIWGGNPSLAQAAPLWRRISVNSNRAGAG